MDSFTLAEEQYEKTVDEPPKDKRTRIEPKGKPQSRHVSEANIVVVASICALRQLWRLVPLPEQGPVLEPLRDGTVGRVAQELSYCYLLVNKHYVTGGMTDRGPRSAPNPNSA